MSVRSEENSGAGDGPTPELEHETATGNEVSPKADVDSSRTPPKGKARKQKNVREVAFTKADYVHMLTTQRSPEIEAVLIWERWLHIGARGKQVWFDTKPKDVLSLRVHLLDSYGARVEETLTYLIPNPSDLKGKRPFIAVPPRGRRWRLVGYDDHDVSAIWRRPHLKKREA